MSDDEEGDLVLTVTDLEGTVIDSIKVFHSDLVAAQRNGITAMSILDGLHLGAAPPVHP